MRYADQCANYNYGADPVLIIVLLLSCPNRGVQVASTEAQGIMSVSGTNRQAAAAAVARAESSVPFAPGKAGSQHCAAHAPTGGCASIKVVQQPTAEQFTIDAAASKSTQGYKLRSASHEASSAHFGSSHGHVENSSVDTGRVEGDTTSAVKSGSSPAGKCRAACMADDAAADREPFAEVFSPQQ